MNFDGKDLTIAVVSDGSAFGATAQNDLVSGDFAAAACLRAGICQADLGMTPRS